MSSSIQKDNIYLVPSSEKIILSKNFDGKYFSKVNLNNITHNFIIFKVLRVMMVFNELKIYPTV